MVVNIHITVFYVDTKVGYISKIRIMELIDKAAVVTEIERISCENPMDNSWYVDTEELLNFLNTLEVVKEVQEEPVSEDLIGATNNYCVNARKGYPRVMDETDRYICNAFKAGANWQKEQFEKNRLEHCDAQTEKEAEIEQSFVMGIIENEHRCPTFDDAIKYGMRLKEKEMQSTIELAEDHAMLAGMEKMKEEMTKYIWKPADGDNLPEIDREVIALLDNGKVVFAHRPPEFWDGKDIVTGKVTRYYPKTYDKGGWNIPDVKWWLDCLLPKEIEL